MQWIGCEFGDWIVLSLYSSDFGETYDRPDTAKAPNPGAVAYRTHGNDLALGRCEYRPLYPEGYRMDSGLAPEPFWMHTKIPVPTGCCGNRSSSVGIATRLWAGCPTNRVSISGRGNVQTGFGAHSASCIVGTGGKAAGAWSWPLIFI
jgi:hypothetical protein